MLGVSELSERDAQEVIQMTEVDVPAPGIAVASIAPYVYRLELKERT